MTARKCIVMGASARPCGGFPEGSLAQDGGGELTWVPSGTSVLFHLQSSYALPLSSTLNTAGTRLCFQLHIYCLHGTHDPGMAVGREEKEGLTGDGKQGERGRERAKRLLSWKHSSRGATGRAL